jgi:hypothetical protein
MRSSSREIGVVPSSGRIVAKQEVIRSMKSLLDEVPEKRGYICLPDPPNWEHTENQDFWGPTVSPGSRSVN